MTLVNIKGEKIFTLLTNPPEGQKKILINLGEGKSLVLVQGQIHILTVLGAGLALLSAFFIALDPGQTTLSRNGFHQSPAQILSVKIPILNALETVK